jgi:hypothetical protein
MRDYDATEQAYKNGYTDGFKNGLNKVEKWLKEYPIQTVLEILSHKEVLLQGIWEK